MVTVIFKTPQDLFHAAAEDFTKRAIAAIHKNNSFNVVLSGGETPHYFFDMLVNIPYCKEKTPWNKIKFFFGDERYVPSDNILSNYHMAYQHLFSKVPILPENIYKIPTTNKNPQESAQQYELLIHDIKLDLVYLGLGEDGHTASLMPVNRPKENFSRVTLSAATLNNSGCIIFLVTGDNKASAVHAVLKGPNEPHKYPAQLIHCSNGKTIWYLDEAAAKNL